MQRDHLLESYRRLVSGSSDCFQTFFIIITLGIFFMGNILLSSGVNELPDVVLTLTPEEKS